MGEHDVDGEECGVREREGHPDRLAFELDVRQQIDADNRETERRGVPGRSGAERGQQDHGQELDRRDSPERQPVDGDVEAHVHHRKDRAEREHDVSSVAVEAREPSPRPSPEGEHHRRTCDPKPGDAERLDPSEEEHRERGPEIVEDRAPDEERLRAGFLCEAGERTGHTDMVASVLR